MIDVFLIRVGRKDDDREDRPWTFAPRQALHAFCGPPRRKAGEVEPFPGPLPIGHCMIPPRGMTFFEYKPEKHGPLVPCSYDTAAY